MFQQKYIVIEIIGRNSQKQTSIVKDKNNHYFISKRVKANDQATVKEINIIRSLVHPNILALHEIINDGDWMYLISQYCQEGDLEYYLSRHLKMKKNIPEDVVGKWMLQILLAIQYLHFSKVIHRDIRPRNIFLTSNGNIKIGSFKASKILQEEIGYAQTLINSPYYMTPQLLQGKNYDYKVDIWAFGCVIYEICTLHRPTNMINLAQLIGRVTKPKIKDLPNSYSKQLNILYQKCMKRNPLDRISARQLLKTSYILHIMQSFIHQQGFNETKSEKLPIKKYKIHRLKLNKLKLKKKLITQKQIDKYNLLPKIKQSNQKKDNKQILPEKRQRNTVGSRQKSNDKKDIIYTPILKGSSLSKIKSQRNSSTQRRISSRENKERNKQQIYHFNIQKKSQQKLPIFQGQKILMKAPPLLPKQRKNTVLKQQKQLAKTEGSTQLQNTMSKQQLTKQLINFKKRQNNEENDQLGLDGLKKMLKNLGIDEEQQIDFDFSEDSQLRLTNKSSTNQAAQLIKTYKSKLQQLIQQINYKYCPNMQPIIQKTMQFDSNTFAAFKYND